jgi:hypothetical protein
MGLMQLLTVGRSLSEARDRPHRFKVLSRAMPTFGHSMVMDAKPEMKGVAGLTDSGEEIMKAEDAQTAGKAAGSGMNAYPLGRWTLRVNPFKSSSKPGRAPVVQGELSLDKVKVVRNDLSDADLELVAVARRAKTGDGAGNIFGGGGAVKDLKPSIWARFRSRWLRAKAR